MSQQINDSLLSGTSGDDVLIGGSGNDTINGLAGNDLIMGFAGNDTINGGAGDDFIIAGDGNDTIDGGVGNDYIIGGNGNNTYVTTFIGAGQDVIEGRLEDRLVINNSSVTFKNILGFVNGEDLILTYKGDTTDSITIKEFFSSDYQISPPAGANQSYTYFQANLALNGTNIPLVFYNYNNGGNYGFINQNDDYQSIADYTTYTKKATPYNTNYKNFNPLNFRVSGDTYRYKTDQNNIVSGMNEYNSDGKLVAEYNFGVEGNSEHSYSKTYNKISYTYDTLGNRTSKEDCSYDATGTLEDYQKDVMTNFTSTPATGSELLHVSLPAYISSNDEKFSKFSDAQIILTNMSTNGTQTVNLNYSTISGGAFNTLYHGDIEVDGVAGNDTLTQIYDANGRLLYDYSSFGFDPEIKTYSYNADGKIAEETYAEMDSMDGNDTIDSDVYDYTYVNGKPVSMTDAWTDDEPESGTNPYYYSDILGSYNSKTKKYNYTGTSGGDLISGSYGGNDSIDGKAGNDTILGVGGNNSLLGGLGDDSIIGGIGNDTTDGGAGNDVITGNGGSDYLLGGLGNDNITGGTGDDSIDGGAGDDVISGLGGNNIMVGGLGNDTITGGAGSDIIDGGAGADSIIGGDGNNMIFGELGDDTITAGAGGDSIDGGAGNDLINGGDGNNIIIGNLGNDTIIGGVGNDTIDGGAGADSMIGGNGNDTYVVDNSSDVITEHNDITGGIDTVIATISYTLGNNLENLTLAGKSNINAQGTLLDNTIIGNDGNNLLNGWDGNDTLIGGKGVDTLYGGVGKDSLAGGVGNDLYLISSGDGNDTITDTTGTGKVTSTVKFMDFNLSDVTGLALTNDTVPGSTDYDLTLTQSTNNNVEMKFLRKDHAILQFQDGLSFDVKNFANFQTTATGNDSANAMYISSATSTISGGGGNDLIIYAGGNDTIYGGDGNDIITTRSGDDVLAGDKGNDIYEVSKTSGNDTIIDKYGTSTIKLCDANLSDISAVTQGTNSVISTLLGATGFYLHFDLQPNQHLKVDVLGKNSTILQFADGVSIDLKSYKNFIKNGDSDSLTGTSKSDFMYLTSTTGAINGGAGNDLIIYDFSAGVSISGGAGNDILVGGSGNDNLDGGAGNDIYAFNTGDGHDTITDSAGTDTIVLGTGVSLDNVGIYRDSITGNESIDYGNSAGQDKITINAGTKIERIQAADGSYLTNKDIDSLINDMNSYISGHSLHITSVGDVRGDTGLMSVVNNSWHLANPHFDTAG